MDGSVDDVNLESIEAPRKGPAGMGDGAGREWENLLGTATASA